MTYFRLIIGLSLFLSGCAVGPDFTPPQPPSLDAYTKSVLPEKTVEAKTPGGKSQRFVWGKDIPACWWYLFHSKPLNKLIEKGLRNSPNIQAAQAALREAEQNLNVSIGALFPYVYAQSVAGRQQFSASEFGIPAPPLKFNLYNANVNVSYIIDIWGGARRQIESSEALLDQQRFLLEAAYLTLTSNIVTSAITEASLREQIRATQELISLQKEQFEITEKKLKLGGASKLDVTAQQTQLAQTQSNLPVLEQTLSKTRDALSVLIGSFPCENGIPAFSLADLTLPQDLPLSLPSSLVQQRPDIRAAEELLHSASAQIGVATANLLPQLTLTASYGGASNFLKKLFTKNAEVWNIMGNVLQPLFKGGALIAQREANIAAFDQAFAQYRQTVLQGFQNVADTLHALENDARQLQIQTEAENAARETFILTETQYQAGTISYLNLLDAQKVYLQARIGRIQAQAARYTDTAALFQALGGGWWNRPCSLSQEDKCQPSKKPSKNDNK